MKTRIKPMVSWSIWAGGLSLVMGIVTREQLVKGFLADNTGMSAVIAAVFGAGLVISFFAARRLHSEWIVMQYIEETGKIPKTGKRTDLAAVFRKLASHKEKMEAVDIHAAIDTYHSKHNSRVRSVSILAALVISMGLLGTVVGLILSISGLGGMVEHIGLSRATMMTALKTTVAGMGTAFYTTFFGALGGLILRAVAVSQLNSLSELCAEATEYADAHLTPRFENKEEELNQKVSQVISSFDNMQKEVETITARLTESFESVMSGFGSAIAEAGNQVMMMTKDCITDMTEQVANEVGRKVNSSLAVFNKSMELSGKDVRKTFRTINTSIGRYGDKMNKAFDGLSNTVQQSGGATADSFGAFNATVKEGGDSVANSLADFKIQIDSTCSDLHQAMDALQSTIHRSTHEMNSLAKARLDVEATEIAGQLSLAANSIQQFLSKKTTTDENQKVA